MADFDSRELQTLASVAAEQQRALGVRQKRKRLFALLIGAIATAGLGTWLLSDTDHVTTDNAYVGAEVAQITPLVSGAVAAVEVVNTDAVKRGDVLVIIDDADARLTLQRAEAEYNRVRRQFGQMTATSDALSAQLRSSGAQVSRAKAQLGTAAANLAKAKLDLSRRKRLAASGAVSAEELTSAQNAYAVAEGSYAEAQASVAQAESAYRSAAGSLRANEALVSGANVDTHPDVAAAKAKLDQAQLDLSRTIIRSPVDGIVTNRQVQVGQRIAAGAQAMTVVPIGQVYVDANFKEGQLGRVKAGQPVELTSDLYGGDVVFHGRVAGFSGGTGSAFALIPAQNATGNWIKVVQRLPVRIKLDPTELVRHPLRVGLSMEASIDVSEKD